MQYCSEDMPEEDAEILQPVIMYIRHRQQAMDAQHLPAELHEDDAEYDHSGLEQQMAAGSVL